VFYESCSFFDLPCAHLWAVINFPDAVGSAMYVEACSVSVRLIGDVCGQEEVCLKNRMCTFCA
jgi:hypothetical protein